MVRTESPDSSTSSSLLWRAKSQDQSAWDRLVHLYSPLVYHWCTSSGLQDADSAEVGQEVFASVSRKLVDFQHQGEGNTFRGWLRVITRNKIRDFVRKKRVDRVGQGGSDAQRNFLRVPADDAVQSNGEPPQTYEARLLYRRALDLIRTEFEEGSWQAFLHVVVEDQHPKDVAAKLGKSVNAVYLARSRILRRLRQEFGELLS